METLLILAAAMIAVLALAFAWVTSARERRPPLRTRQEEELVGGDPEGLIAAMTPAPASPIDRNAPILEITSIEAALMDTRLFEGRAGTGPVIAGDVGEDRGSGGEHAEDTRADEWKPAESDEPTEPRVMPRKHGSR